MPQPQVVPPHPLIRVAHRTDPGRDPEKQVNEDSFGTSHVSLGHVLVVCDGMGGHMSGREASTQAVQTILADLTTAAPGANPGAALKASIEHAARVVYELGGSSVTVLRPGSTCVALLIHAGGCEIAHVGDSRAYLVRAGQAAQITRDHSMVQEMVDAGLLQPQDAMVHPEANKITRALGMRPAVDVELAPSPLALMPGDVLALCSDGLSDLVSSAELASALSQLSRVSLEQACDILVSLALSRGGHDNITLLAAEVLGADGKSGAFVPVQSVTGQPIAESEPKRTVQGLPADEVFQALGQANPGKVRDELIVASSAPAKTLIDPGLAADAVAAQADVDAIGRPTAPMAPSSGVSSTLMDQAFRARPGLGRSAWTGDAIWLVFGAILVVLGLILAAVCVWWLLKP